MHLLMSMLGSMQVVRLIVAGGLMHSTDSLSQATMHIKPRQQAATLAPLR